MIVVEEAIDAADLPNAVQQALSDVLEDHKIELVEKLRRDNVVTYEIKSKHADVAIEIVFDVSGKVLKIAGAGAKSAPSSIEGEESERGGEREKRKERRRRQKLRLTILVFFTVVVLPQQPPGK